MTAEQIEEWDANEARKYNEWLYDPSAGDHSDDWAWMAAHSGGTW